MVPAISIHALGVLGVTVKSEMSRRCKDFLESGIFSCGYRKTFGEPSLESGGDGGRGVIGDVQDPALWNESCDSVGEFDSDLST